MSVEWTSEDKMHIAFMGPPLLPILATCFCGEVKRFDPEEIKRDEIPLEKECKCGKTISLGKDEVGWYIQGASSLRIGKNL